MIGFTTGSGAGVRRFSVLHLGSLGADRPKILSSGVDVHPCSGDPAVFRSRAGRGRSVRCSHCRLHKWRNVETAQTKRGSVEGPSPTGSSLSVHSPRHRFHPHTRVHRTLGHFGTAGRVWTGVDPVAEGWHLFDHCYFYSVATEDTQTVNTVRLVKPPPGNISGSPRSTKTQVLSILKT